MNFVDICLFCLVGYTVLVFLLLQNLVEKGKSCQKAEQNRVTCDSEAKTEKDSSFDELVDNIDDQVERESVGADGEAEKKVIFDNTKVLDDQEFQKILDACSRVLGFGEISDFFDGVEENLDDWEGIERTELEKRFGEAVVYVSSKNNAADKIDGDLSLELYGLQQIAIEGPCHGSQPMALMVSARSKWNAWQKLGDMSRELAMENYIDILSKADPGWKVDGTCASSNKLPEDEGSEPIQDAETSKEQTSTICNENGAGARMSSDTHSAA